jgi:hypothetical protein
MAEARRDHEIEFRGLHNRQVSWPLSLQKASGVDANLTRAKHSSFSQRADGPAHRNIPQPLSFHRRSGASRWSASGTIHGDEAATMRVAIADLIKRSLGPSNFGRCAERWLRARSRGSVRRNAKASADRAPKGQRVAILLIAAEKSKTEIVKRVTISAPSPKRFMRISTKRWAQSRDAKLQLTVTRNSKHYA